MKNRVATAVVGSGMTGISFSNVLAQASQDFVVYEWGAMESASRMTHPLLDPGGLFNSPFGGLRLGVGGRSHCWEGVLLPAPISSFASLRGFTPQKAREAFVEQSDVATRLHAEAPKSAPFDLTRLEWSPVLRANEHFLVQRPNTLVRERLSLRDQIFDIRVDGGSFLLSGLRGECLADRVVLAAGALESARLVGTMYLTATGLTEVLVGGLGDHEAVGFCVLIDEPSLERRQYLYTCAHSGRKAFLDIYPRGMSTCVDVWGFVEVGGGGDQGILVRRDGDVASASISYESTTEEEALVADYSSFLLSLLPLVGTSIDADSLTDVPLESCKHYAESTFNSSEWNYYRCRAGGVHHEFCGSGIDRLLNSMGISSQSILTLGGAQFSRIGFENPSLSYIAAATVEARHWAQ